MAEGRQEGTRLEDFAGRRSGTGLSEESTDDEHQADVVSRTLVGKENADVASKTLPRVESPDGEIETLIHPGTSNVQALQPQPRPNVDQEESDLQPPAEDLLPPAEGFQRIRHWACQQLDETWIRILLPVLLVALLAGIYIYVYDILSDQSQPQSTLAVLDKDFTTVAMKVERK